MVGVQAEQTLAQVDKSLGDAHKEQMVRILCVIHGKSSQQPSDTRVIGARTNDTQSENCILRNLKGIREQLQQRVGEAPPLK